LDDLVRVRSAAAEAGRYDRFKYGRARRGDSDRRWPLRSRGLGL